MSRSKAAMGKRRRDTDDDAFLDNYHKHKRYLTEVMASSMNGLKVCDASGRCLSPPSGDPMVSPAQTDTGGTGGLSRSASSFPSHGDETSTLDSPMSDDSDESVGYRMRRGSDAIQYSSSYFSEQVLANSTSPSTPRRIQRLPSVNSGLPSLGSSHWVPSRLPSTPSAWPRNIDADGRLPPSPSDPCQAADLRRAALLRTLHMRSQQPISHTSLMATNSDKVEEVQETEEPGDQSSPTPNSYDSFDQVEECSQAVLGSPNHGVFSGPVARGSPSVRSLRLGERVAPAGPLLSIEDEMVKVSRSSKFDGDVIYTRSPRSPRSPKAGASSSGYEESFSFSTKDGNISDTESSLGPRKSSTRTILSRQSSVCSNADTQLFPHV